ncbi:MAG: hypothetical protein V1874_04070 [Spirochaetota bacterium]
MDSVLKNIEHNPVITVLIAGLLLFIAGLIVRKLKIVAVILIIIAGIAFYVILKSDRAGKMKIDEIKSDVKSKVMEKIK